VQSDNFSYRIDAAEGPEGKATLMFCNEEGVNMYTSNTEKEEEVASCSQVKVKSKGDLWYSWVEEQERFDASNRWETV
jgi:hypothetical protein